jgi:hypothetical protein
MIVSIWDALIWATPWHPKCANQPDYKEGQTYSAAESSNKGCVTAIIRTVQPLKRHLHQQKRQPVYRDHLHLNW